MLAFWNHSKQHSSKTLSDNEPTPVSFGTIRNNTALKLVIVQKIYIVCFGTIRNNTALKQHLLNCIEMASFGTIRNNTALKLLVCLTVIVFCFGTIRNNTALKPRRLSFFLPDFVIALFISA